jgi:hypothetical protein
MTQVQTPLSLSDLTADWFSSRLGCPVEHIDVQRIGEGEGFMGQLARVGLRGAPQGAPRSVIVKLPTADPGARAMGEMMGVWSREHHFYDELADRVVVRVPGALVNDLDPPCLVLEDLAPSRPGDHVAGATLSQAERAIDALARHHASFFGDPSLAALEWLPGLDDPQVEVLGPMFEAGWPAFLARYGDRLPARCLRWCESFAVDIPGWLSKHADMPCTLTHGDFRLDNIFFSDDDDASVAFIDWQLCMRAPGQADLVYFCANNLSVELRREHEHALIERYVRGLHAAGVAEDQISVDSVTYGYHEGLVFYATSFAAGLLSIDPSNERGVALFDALVMRTFAALDDLAAGEVIGL